MKMKKILSLSLLLAFMACSKDDTAPVVAEEPSKEEPKPEEQPDKSVLGAYSSFEVAISGSPYKINEIANSTYEGSYSAYGFSPYVDFEVNDDNTVDVFWLDKKATTNAGRNITRISIDSKNVVENITVPAVANVKGSKFIGFLGLKNNDFVIGYSEKVNPTDVLDSIAVYSKFDKSGAVKFNSVIFGAKEGRYDPGHASTNAIAYNKETNSIGIHFGFMSGGHQAGWLSFIDNTNGKTIKTSAGLIAGRSWFLSHSMDQRIMASGDKFYALAHGDAGNHRGVRISSFAQNEYKSKIDGLKFFTAPGDGNKTQTRTGDFIELPNGDVAIIYSTIHSRINYDLKLVIVRDMKTNTPKIVKETWITNNTEDLVGWGMQLALFGDNKILIGWNQWKDWANATGSFFTVADFEGNVVGKTEAINEPLFNHGQSMKRTKDGKKLVFVSVGSGDKLKVNTIDIK